MTTDSEQTHWSVAGLLDLFDARPAQDGRFVADTGIAAEDERQVVEGTQVLAQVIVAVAKRFGGNLLRWSSMPCSPAPWWSDRRSTSTSTSSPRAARRRPRWSGSRRTAARAITATTLLDVPSADVIRHHLPKPEVTAPRDANDGGMPMAGRELRFVDVVDVNSPDEVGPPELYAWLHYDPIPSRDDLAKALVAYFTGHLGISTTMRAHEGIGTAQSHLTVSTAPMTVSVSFPTNP